jgi:hypothetical protein
LPHGNGQVNDFFAAVFCDVTGFGKEFVTERFEGMLDISLPDTASLLNTP